MTRLPTSNEYLKWPLNIHWIFTGGSTSPTAEITRLPTSNEYLKWPLGQPCKICAAHTYVVLALHHQCYTAKGNGAAQWTLKTMWCGLDWIEQGLTSHSTHFRSFRRQWGDCGISQDCSRSQSPQCVRYWVVCAWPMLITVVCMCMRCDSDDTDNALAYFYTPCNKTSTIRNRHKSARLSPSCSCSMRPSRLITSTWPLSMTHHESSSSPSDITIMSALSTVANIMAPHRARRVVSVRLLNACNNNKRCSYSVNITK